MFKVEIKNLSISANLGITELERKKKQLLKVTLSFDYKVKDSLNLNNINNVKNYYAITKFLKTGLFTISLKPLFLSMSSSLRVLKFLRRSCKGASELFNKGISKRVITL